MNWLLLRFLGCTLLTVFSLIFRHESKLIYTEATYRKSLQVLVFFDTECPICQKTTQRVQQLADQYADQVQFEVVYPTETVTLAEVKMFERTFKLTIPHRLDPVHTIVKQYNITTTPEVVLISDQHKILYRGSVDDQFYRLGRYRPAPTAFYLKDAINNTLSGKPVTVRQTTPTGCLINRD